MPTRIIRFSLPTIIILFACLAPVATAWAAEPYKSPMRSQCEAELAKDPGWQAELRQDVRPEVHQEDANILVKNKRYVVISYGALWGLTVVFLVLMWLRQRRLLQEMERLAQQIKKAAAD